MCPRKHQARKVPHGMDHQHAPALLAAERLRRASSADCLEAAHTGADPDHHCNTGANRDATKITSSNIEETTARRCRMKRRSTTLSWLSCVASSARLLGPMVRAVLVVVVIRNVLRSFRWAALRELDARVDDGVEDVAVIEVNELQKRRVIGKLKRHLGEQLRGMRIALLGLAFKPNTDDIRQASSIILAGRLLAEGAHVTGYDPVAMDGMRTIVPGMEYAESALSALEGADACVLVTEWAEFLGLDWAEVKRVMAQPVVIDGRNVLDGAALAAMGFVYEGVGTRVRSE